MQFLLQVPLAFFKRTRNFMLDCGLEGYVSVDCLNQDLQDERGAHRPSVDWDGINRDSEIPPTGKLNALLHENNALHSHKSHV